MADLNYIQQAQEVKITGQDNVGTTVNYVGADSSGNMMVTDSAGGADGSAAPAKVLQVGAKDTGGNLQAFVTRPSGEQFVLDVLNSAAQYRAQSVTTTAAEALGAASILSGRKLLHVTPTNGVIYWGYSSAVTTATGTPIFPNNTLWLSVTDSLHVYVIAPATTDARIGELA